MIYLFYFLNAPFIKTQKHLVKKLKLACKWLYIKYYIYLTYVYRYFLYL